MKQIVLVAKTTYKKMMTSKAMWFTMLFPVIILGVGYFLSVSGIDVFTMNTNNINMPKDVVDGIYKAIQVFMSVIFYLIVLTYSNVVAVEMAKDKGSKLLEFTFSSIKAEKYFIGKLIGVIFVLFTNLLIWIVAISALIMSNGIFKSLLSYLAFDKIFIYLLFFILGVILYLVIAAMLGVMVVNVEDANKAASPIVLICVVGYIVSFMDLGNLWNKVLSIVPFTSPFAIPKEIFSQNSDILVIILSLVVMLVFTILTTILTGKLYKKLALNYSKVTGFLGKISSAFFGKKKL